MESSLSIPLASIAVEIIGGLGTTGGLDFTGSGLGSSIFIASFDSFSTVSSLVSVATSSSLGWFLISSIGASDSDGDALFWKMFSF